MNQRGFIPVAVLLIVLAIGTGVSGGAIYYAMRNKGAANIPVIVPPTSTPAPQPAPISPQESPAPAVTPPPAPKPLSPTPPPQKAEAPKLSEVKWNFDFPNQAWKVSGNPPACPAPLAMPIPVDISLVTNVLYPGQYRGGNYKTHGGFRFSNASNAATIKAPMDAYIFRGSRYTESGEVQYLFFFISPCGIMYKFDHLLTLSPKLQAIADKFPPAKPDDTRTTDLTERIMVTTGEVFATEVGLRNNKNVFVDFGVHDLRAPNAISKDLNWAQTHSDYRETNFYGICFFDILPEEDAVRLKMLSTGNDNTTSDYCTP